MEQSRHTRSQVNTHGHHASIMINEQSTHLPFFLFIIVRAGAHTDYGTITLLFQKDIGSLEVQASRTEWISAPIIEGTILGK